MKISNSVTVELKGSAGRGVFSNSTIRPNELVMSIPRGEMITPGHIGKELDAFYPNWGSMELDCYGTFSLFIALELRKLDASQFSTYLKSMPPSFDLLLLNWPDDYDQFLMKNVLQSKARLKALFANKYKQLNSTYNPEHNVTSIREREFRYGFSAVKTRAMNWPYGMTGQI